MKPQDLLAALDAALAPDPLVELVSAVAEYYHHPGQGLESAKGLDLVQRKSVVQYLDRIDEQVGQGDPIDESVEIANSERLAAAELLQRLVWCDLEDILFGIDFAMELRISRRLVSPAERSLLFRALVKISRSEGLDRESHGGYHFHYVLTRGAVKRTDLLLTFDPDEIVGPPDSLYWERHGRGAPLDPTRWRLPRKRAVHCGARPSIVKPGKQHFRRPSNSSRVLLRA